MEFQKGPEVSERGVLTPTKASDMFIDKLLYATFSTPKEDPFHYFTQHIAIGNAIASGIFAAAGKPELATQAILSATILQVALTGRRGLIAYLKK